VNTWEEFCEAASQVVVELALCLGVLFLGLTLTSAVAYLSYCAWQFFLW
jgi:hypothetical protein